MIKSAAESGWREARRRSARDAILGAAWALVAEEGLAGLSLRDLARNGVSEPRLVDLFTALVTGLADQQVANDPGGNRWTRLGEEAIAMFLDRCQAGRAPATGLLTTIVPF